MLTAGESGGDRGAGRGEWWVVPWRLGEFPIPYSPERDQTFGMRRSDRALTIHRAPDTPSAMQRTYEGLPAPDRDMANVSPEVGPVESDVGPVTNTLFSWLTIGFGVAVGAWGVVGMFLARGHTFAAATAMLAAGMCFVMTGVLMRGRSLLLPFIAAMLGILLGIASQSGL